MVLFFRYVMSDAHLTKIKHRPLLDGTRGVMMCVVLGYHLGGPTKLPGAWVSMDFFFVLSGYLITTLLVKEYAQQGRLNLGLFYRRRVRRLGPALLAMLAGVFIIAGFLGGAETFPGLRKDGLSTLFYVANWRFIFSAQSYFDSFNISLLRHAWSLAIEEQFYLAWPLVFIGLALAVQFNRYKMMLILGVALIASVLWMSHLAQGNVDLSRAYYGTDTRGQGLLVGSMMALFLWRDRWDSVRARGVASWLGTLALLGLVVMMFVFADTSRAVYTHAGFLLITLTSAVFIFGCARADSGPLNWIFGNRLSRHMGVVSYSFYLWHWPIIVFMSPARLDWNPWMLDAARVAVSLGLAELTYWYLEKPIHEQRWTMRHQGRVMAAAFIACLALLYVVTSNSTSPTTQERTGPAPEKRVMVLGDSLGFVLAILVPPNYPFQVEGSYQAHCDIIGNRIYTGSTIDEVTPKCHGWQQRWAAALRGESADVSGSADAVLVTLGLRQLFDIAEEDQRIVVGSTAWENRYRKAVNDAVAIIRSATDAPVLWLDVPCYRWDASGGDGEEYDAERLNTVNRLLKEVLSEHEGIEVVAYSKTVCRGPNGTESDPVLRPDGAHLTPQASAELWHSLESRFKRLTGTQ